MDMEEIDVFHDVRKRMEYLAEVDRSYHLNDDGDAYNSSKAEDVAAIPFFTALTTYLGYSVLILIGHIRDVCATLFRKGRYLNQTTSGKKVLLNDEDVIVVKNPKDYAPLLKSWENFYTRRCYHRIQDCFNRPIACSPSSNIEVIERISMDGNKTMQLLGRNTVQNGNQPTSLENGKKHSNGSNGSNGTTAFNGTSDSKIVRNCLNLGSYNYLGVADDWHSICQKEVSNSLDKLPVSCSSSRHEFGTTNLHKEAERVVAEFLQKDDAIIFNMGFNTNATAIPAFLSTKDDLILSDELNHTSIVNGARASGAVIRTFRHNDACHLEQLLRDAIVSGHPRTRRPWKKIMVIVEGIYSMEGEYCNLRAISHVCNKYQIILYLDEAHSIGAMGRTGRGCCEYTQVDTRCVDIMMGTFTKSFGGMGGYIAGRKSVLKRLRTKCAGFISHNSLSPVVCQQVITSLNLIMGRDGTSIGKRKLDALRDNSNYFRMRLTDMGLHVLGNYDSPVVPVMLYNPTKIAAFSRECLKRGIAVVVVGFPAVPILMSRARICVSAGHTRAQLDRALKEIEEVADILKLRYRRSTIG